MLDIDYKTKELPIEIKNKKSCIHNWIEITTCEDEYRKYMCTKCKKESRW